jgi:hypothetical protein
VVERPPETHIKIDGEAGKFPGGGGGGGGVVQFSGRFCTPEDVANGLCVSSFFPANAIDVPGLFNVLGGAWEFYGIRTIPSDVFLRLVCVVELGSIPVQTLLRFEIRVLDPCGDVAVTDQFDISLPDYEALTRRKSIARQMKFSATVFGVWCIQMRSGDANLAQYNLEIRQA